MGRWLKDGWVGAPPYFIAHTDALPHHHSTRASFFLSFSFRFLETLGVHGSLRLLLVSMWVFRAAAVLSDLQCVRSKMLHGISGVLFPDMGSVLTKHLFAKYSEAVKECFGADLRKLQSWLYELANPELIVVYAESQARGVSVTTILKR